MSLDERSQMALYTLMNRGVIARLGSPIRQGKESLVLHGLASDDTELAVKVHTSRVFGNRERRQYVLGDWRYRHAKKHVVSRTESIWAEKEFRDLVRLQKAQIVAPAPVSFEQNIVVMAFIGEQGIGAPQLNELKDADYEYLAEHVSLGLRKLVLEADLVHGDLSPYNILVWNKNPYIIDISQAVLTSHPEAARLLNHDIANLAAYFEERGVEGRRFHRMNDGLLEELSARGREAVRTEQEYQIEGSGSYKVKSYNTLEFSEEEHPTLYVLIPYLCVAFMIEGKPSSVVR